MRYESFTVDLQTYVQLVADEGESKVSAARNERPHPANMLQTRQTLFSQKIKQTTAEFKFFNHSGCNGTTGTNWYICTLCDGEQGYNQSDQLKIQRFLWKNLWNFQI